MHVLSIGEILYDVFPDQELLGGAPLNFTVNSMRLGDTAALITAVGTDARGRASTDAMQSLGLSTAFVQVVDGYATGVALVSTTAEGEPTFSIPRPAAFDALRVSPDVIDAAKRMQPDWLYFGTLHQVDPHAEAATTTLMQSLPGVRCFYDMNLRTGNWNLPLVLRLCGQATVLKLNEAEARTLSDLTGLANEGFSLEEFCKEWADRYSLEAVCVTLGSAGCFVYQGSVSCAVAGYEVAVRDTVGAGDAFAAAFLHGYHRKWSLRRTASFANALGSLVASRAGATPVWTLEECLQIAGVRDRDRTATE